MNLQEQLIHESAYEMGADSRSVEISELKAKVAALTDALEAIYADGKLPGGAGPAYSLVISHQSIARRALGLKPPF